ncbi:hypothetical protein LCI18_006863 [Fusarium solani-melongenae]|uniref:Uncharacterized protein n=1 Tax=Fusarium solani subsp. cucurbitae TaxID=2747967 RepID=A0ACD3Z768_FUSSC|nr:hypothetical protein LCI18_006863 [Fusarium solani-melongenae]
MDTDSTIDVLRPSIEENSGPDTLVLSGQSIFSENTASIPLYQLNKEVTSTSQKGSTIMLERVEYDGPGDAESMASIKQRNQHLFYLVHPVNAQYRTDLPAYYITSASPDMVGNVKLQASKNLLQKVEFKAILSAGKTSSSDELFGQDNQEILFEVKPRWKGGQYQWTDSVGKIAHEEEKAEHKLVISALIPQQTKDALVALWALRIWHDTLETRAAKREGEMQCAILNDPTRV